MATVKMSAQDKKWQAEQDARTLADAEEILKNRSRRSAAATAAKKLAVDAQNQVKKYNRVRTKAKTRKRIKKGR